MFVLVWDWETWFGKILCLYIYNLDVFVKVWPLGSVGNCRGRIHWSHKICGLNMKARRTIFRWWTSRPLAMLALGNWQGEELGGWVIGRIWIWEGEELGGWVIGRIWIWEGEELGDEELGGWVIGTIWIWEGEELGGWGIGRWVIGEIWNWEDE